MLIKKRLERFLEIQGKRMLFYHQDADGVCSAALMLKFYPFRAEAREGPGLSDIIPGLLKEKPDLLCFLDLPIDQEWKDFRKLDSALQAILVIDHHIPERDLNSERTLYINPMLKSQTYQAASYLVFKLLKELGKPVEPYSWIACIGIIGDHAVEGCRELIEYCRKFWPFEDVWKSGLARASELISAAITLKGQRGAKFCLDLLLRSEDLSEFLFDPGLQEWKERLDRELEKLERDFRLKREEIGNLLLYEIKSDLNITSLFASRMAVKNPERIILIRKRSDSRWKLSIRAPPGIDLSALVKSCVKGIGKGGGHRQAAGATISDWEVFRKRFIQALKGSSP